MKNASKKIKSLFIGAIILIALLLITVIAQIITIYKKQQINLAQQEEISRLENEKEYYQNDKENPDSEIVVEDN